MKILIKRGQTLQYQLSIQGVSILHRAARKSTDGEIVKFMLGHLAAQELVNTEDIGSDTLLHDRVNSQIAAKMLLVHHSPSWPALRLRPASVHENCKRKDPQNT